jgi:predicted DNA repair protein MutK
MATGLLALLDDVAAIAKLAAGSLDDVVAQTGKASVKAAGVVIDDAAVTPRYVVGLSPAREIPIIARIALGSLRNKLLYLLPLCLLLDYFAPWSIVPLLMIGGIYLCFEGTEKLYEALFPHAAHEEEDASEMVRDPVALENEKVAGAVRTDFILSAEIMALTLANVSDLSVYAQAAVLAAVGILITVAVYGVVAMIVKADDLGLAMAGSTVALWKGLGRGLVVGVPVFLKVLATIGTAAMLWVGGSIIIHGLAEMGFHLPEHLIEQASHHVMFVLHVVPAVTGWVATSALQAVVGIALGAIAVALVHVVKPLLVKPH